MTSPVEPTFLCPRPLEWFDGIWVAKKTQGVGRGLANENIVGFQEIAERDYDTLVTNLAQRHDRPRSRHDFLFGADALE